MWVGAHPDDEVLVSPILASVCLGDAAVCSLLILTRGEQGSCLLPAGCGVALSTVRSGEAGRGSDLFQADLILQTLADGGGRPDGSAPNWEAAFGGRERLVARFATLIEAVAPEVVLTFDPRHGTTCHPDHRATGQLVVDALRTLARPPRLFFLETRARVTLSPVRMELHSPAPLGALIRRFDANRSLSGSTETGWDWMLKSMRIHRSQFDDAWLRAVEQVPEAQRVVYYASAEAASAVTLDECH
ncbi:MAG TPA: PIG-L family deacetylase [Thermoanaerobaculia bacterium]|nr:PIG-L family deacetylase [Thermoanaerobaculia bacterium]